MQAKDLAVGGCRSQLHACWVALSPEHSALGALYKANFGSHLFQIVLAAKLFFFQNKNIIRHSKIIDQKEAFLFEVEISNWRSRKGPTLKASLLPYEVPETWSKTLRCQWPKGASRAAEFSCTHEHCTSPNSNGILWGQCSDTWGHAGNTSKSNRPRKYDKW